jgi:hypothetical protein
MSRRFKNESLALKMLEKHVINVIIIVYINIIINIY